MWSRRAFGSFLVPLVLVIGLPGRLHAEDGSSIRIEKHAPLTTGRDRLLSASCASCASDRQAYTTGKAAFVAGLLSAD
jgi:hypothetical protein